MPSDDPIERKAAAMLNEFRLGGEMEKSMNEIRTFAVECAKRKMDALEGKSAADYIAAGLIEVMAVNLAAVRIQLALQRKFIQVISRGLSESSWKTAVSEIERLSLPDVL